MIDLQFAGVLMFIWGIVVLLVWDSSRKGETVNG